MSPPCDATDAPGKEKEPARSGRPCTVNLSESLLSLRGWASGRATSPVINNTRRITMNPTTNGQTRKTLSAQLDRLDSILDGLSNALNESIATAVKEATAQAVQQAVQATLTEILTSPELLSLIGTARAMPPMVEGVPAPVASSAPSLRGRIGSALSWAGQKIRSVWTACGRKLYTLRPRLLGLWGLRRQLLLALGIGTAAGLAAYLAGPLAAGAFSGVAAFASGLAVQTRLWLKKLVANPTL